MRDTFEKTCRHLFQLTATRVRERKAYLKEKGVIKGDSDIYAEELPLVSRIINFDGTTCPKNNKYLIPFRAVSSFVENLQFVDDHELFWGGDEEIKRYANELFFNMTIDILNGDKNEVRTALYELLIEYVPYAKWSAYSDICALDRERGFAYYEPMLSLCGLDEDELIRDVTIAEKEAIARLFSKQKKDSQGVRIKRTFGDDFLDAFLTFSREKELLGKRRGANKGFKSLPTRLGEFARERFLPMMKQIMPKGNSLGKRVHTLILEDVSQLDFWNMAGGGASPEEQEEHCISSRLIGELDILRARITASQNYADALGKYQADMDASSDKWQGRW